MEHRSIWSRHSKWLYWLTALSLVGASSIPLFFRTLFRGGSVFATINGVSVSRKEYERLLRQEEEVRRMITERHGGAARMIMEQMGKNEPSDTTILNHLVLEKSLIALGRAVPIEVSPEAAARVFQNQQALSSMLQDDVPSIMYKDGVLNAELFRKYLDRKGMNIGEFEAMLEETLLKTSVAQIIATSLVAPQWFVDEEIIRLAAPRTYTIETVALRIPQDAIAEDALRAFWADENRRAKRYWAPEKRSGTAWLFDFKNEEAAEKWERDAEYFITQGDDVKLKKEIADHGGREISLKQIDASAGQPYLKTLFSLSKAGDRLSGREKLRTYIVELAVIHPREELPFEDVREQVLEDMQRSKALEAAKKGIANPEKSYEVRIAPGDASHAKLEELSIPFQKVRSLALKGLSFEGSSGDTYYRVTLSEIGALDKKLIEKYQGLAHLQKAGSQTYVRFGTEDIIDSLREHAIIRFMQ